MGQSLRVVITGATGMVGEGVLYQCLQHPEVAAVLSISRRPSGYSHPKLRELLQEDLYDIEPLAAQLRGYDACFFCLGISSLGLSEAEYFKVTHTLTLHIADVLCRENPGMTFCYVSGAGTDSTGQGRSMWARVKGKAENALLRLPFKAVYAFRPGFIRPIKGLKHTHGFYRWIGWMFAPGRRLWPGSFVRLEEIALSMIRVAQQGFEKPVLTGRDMITLAAPEEQG